MDTARIEAWLMNEKGIHDTGLRTLPPSTIARRPKPTISTICPDRDWTNPNRFSDPLNRTSRLSNDSSLALTLPRARADNKASSWYLENHHTPWRRNDPAKQNWADWADGAQSLFAAEKGNPKKPGVTATPPSLIKNCEPDDKRMTSARGGGISQTWERTRQTRAACPPRPNTATATATLETGSVLTLPTGATAAAAGRLNLQMLGRGAGFSPFSGPRQSLGAQLVGTTTAAASDANWTITPGSQRRGRSPASSNNSSCSSSSSRSSAASPQGTTLINRLSPGMFHRHHHHHHPHQPASHRLSPSTLLLLQPPSRGGGGSASPFSSPTSRSPSPGRLSQWSQCNSLSRQTSSPFSSNASSSGGGGAGSETDEDFLFVSCHQLTRGLAGLSVAPAATRPPHQHHHHHQRAAAGLSPTARTSGPGGGFRMVENPAFAYPGSGNYGDEEDEFDGCSDDALSDDVFLDDPEQPFSAEVTKIITANDASERGAIAAITAAAGKFSRLSDQQREVDKGKTGVVGSGRKTDNIDAADTGKSGELGQADKMDGAQLAAADALRKNSVQSKMRRTWRQRRHKAAGERNGATGNNDDDPSAKHDTRGASSEKTSSSPDLSALKPPLPPSLASSPASAEEDVPSHQRPPEDKSCYYYVISPTDDDNMPDVIAVRKSSVELIRWQNSLRRRRRRQAKRHDLGRTKAREPKMSATV